MKPSELLSSPEKWTKGESARGADGKKRLCLDSDAVCWCAYGALAFCGCYADREAFEAAAKKLFPERIEATNRTIGINGLFYIAAFNDLPETTFEDVQKVLREAGL